ncbi:hypothetical protein STSO111631_04840 [Stackebrandtia soli]
MRIEQTGWSARDAVALRAAQRAEIADRYGTPDSEPGVTPSAADIVVFLVAYAPDGTPTGCGGLRELDDGLGEIKRMYVAPSWRGTGTATDILRALEECARDRNWVGLRLETGDGQPDAVRFYTRSGYTRIPNFGGYVGEERSWCFERRFPIDAQTTGPLPSEAEPYPPVSPRLARATAIEPPPPRCPRRGGVLSDVAILRRREWSHVPLGWAKVPLGWANCENTPNSNICPTKRRFQPTKPKWMN